MPIARMTKPTVKSIVSLDSAVTLEEQRQGLDWVHWLLQSVRQGCEGVIIARPTSKVKLNEAWRRFAKDKFIPRLGPALLEAQRSMAERDSDGLVAQDRAWADLLDAAERHRSILAGSLLLERTQGARYQGALGHYREAVEEGLGDGHIGIVWPCLAQMFQLSAATMLAEYLRMEWETAARDLYGAAQPVGSVAFAKIVEVVLHPELAEPKIIRRKKAS